MESATPAEPDAGEGRPADAAPEAGASPEEACARALVEESGWEPPFGERFARSPWDDTALSGDAAALGEDVALALSGLLDGVAASGRSRVALLVGAAGAGKTHQLARLRRACAGRAVFTGLDRTADLADVARALSTRLVEDLLRPVDGRPQLAALVDGAAAACEASAATSALLDAKATAASAAVEVVARLQPRAPTIPRPLLGALLAARPLDREPAADEALRARARALAPGELLSAVASLATLAGAPLVFAVDSFEAFEPEARERVARLVAQLLARDGALAVIACESGVWQEARGELHLAERQRLEDTTLTAQPPGGPEVEALVAARLAPLWRGLGLAPPSAIFPFTLEALAQLGERRHQRSVREWLVDLEQAFEDLRRGRRASARRTGPSPRERALARAGERAQPAPAGAGAEAGAAPEADAAQPPTINEPPEATPASPQLDGGAGAASSPQGSGAETTSSPASGAAPGAGSPTPGRPARRPPGPISAEALRHAPAPAALRGRSAGKATTGSRRSGARASPAEVAPRAPAGVRRREATAALVVVVLLGALLLAPWGQGSPRPPAPAPTPDPGPPPAQIRAPEPPAARDPTWHARLPESERPALPAGVVPGGSRGEYLNQRDGSLLVWVPPGAFPMGAAGGRPDEAPAHQVQLTAGYFLGKHEVTWAQYRAFCAATDRRVPSNLIEREFAAGDEHPVFHVSFEDARAYCAWAGLRLPSEAEWEYAARGADERAYPWGEAGEPARLNSRRRPDPRLKTAAVGSFPLGAGPHGCLDQAGNVWEWVADRYGPYDGSPQVDPVGPPVGPLRVIRGGSWSDPPSLCRATVRQGRPPHYRLNNVGFRVARSAAR